MSIEFDKSLDQASAAIERAFFQADTVGECQRLSRKLELYSDYVSTRGAALKDFMSLIDDEKRKRLVAFFERSAEETWKIKQETEEGTITAEEGKRRVLAQIDLMRREVEQVETEEEFKPLNRIAKFYGRGNA